VYPDTKRVKTDRWRKGKGEREEAFKALIVSRELADD